MMSCSTHVKVLGPELWMDNGALEVFDSGNFRRQRVLIIIVSCCEEHEFGMHHLLRAVCIESKSPSLLISAPVRSLDFVSKLDFLVDTVHGSSLLHVTFNRRTVGDSPLFGPRSPGKTKSPQIAVTSNTWIFLISVRTSVCFCSDKWHVRKSPKCLRFHRDLQELCMRR